VLAVRRVTTRMAGQLAGAQFLRDRSSGYRARVAFPDM